MDGGLTSLDGVAVSTEHDNIVGITTLGLGNDVVAVNKINQSV